MTAMPCLHENFEKSKTERRFAIVVPGSLCAFCRVVVPTKPFTNTALYYKMRLESEPTPLATKCFGGFDGGSKANVGHYKMHLRNYFVVKKRVGVKNHESLLNVFFF